MRAKTMETKAKTQNNIRAMLLCALSVALELQFLFLMFTRLAEYAPYIETVLTVSAFFVALWLYGQNKTSAVKMPWILLILVAPVLGLSLYLLIGLDRGTRRMRGRYAAIDLLLLPTLRQNPAVLQGLKAKHPKAGSISQYLCSYAKYPVYQNTDVTYFDDAAKGLESQLAALAKAEHFIFMEYHAIENAEAWQRIQAVLEERVQNGVEVRVFYDDMGSVGFVNQEFANSLNNKGIQCRVFNPFGMGLNMFLNNRDHRKITVIDGKVGFTGGYNLANEYFNITHPFGRWKDTGVRLEGDAVRSLTVAFLENWNAVRGSDRSASANISAAYLHPYAYTAAQKGYIQPYAFGPMSRERIGENVYISMAEKAERYCWFITPYLIITDEMTHAITMAAKRGVDVRIITPGIPDKKLVYSVTRSFYGSLAKSGVRIYEWTPGFCHAKMCVVDDEMAVCGTINLDYRSLYHHFENGCFMVGCDAVKEIHRDLNATMQEALEVTKLYDEEGPFSGLELKQLLLRVFAALL